MSSAQPPLGRLEQITFTFDNPGTFSLAPDGPLPFLIRNFLSRPAASTGPVPLAGKTILITGANSGVGLETAKKCVQQGAAKVIMTARNAERGEEARKLVEAEKGTQQGGSAVELVRCDMASLKSVLECAEAVGNSVGEGGLDIAVLNAGAYHPAYEVSEETGWELSLQVHLYATALLSLLLLPVLQLKPASRLLLVTSEVHAWMTPREPSASAFLHAVNSPTTYKPYQRYHLTKLALQLFAAELSARVAGATVAVGTMTPGFCVTSFFSGGRGQWISGAINATMGRSAEEGSRTYVAAMTAPVAEVGGAYWTCGAPGRACRDTIQLHCEKLRYDKISLHCPKLIHRSIPVTTPTMILHMSLVHIFEQQHSLGGEFPCHFSPANSVRKHPWTLATDTPNFLI
ncbi:hypothetical protein EDC01DRAFT_629759 [Geopyxis carbonaria]|nr:hypothetical protein EDC01DRAFT_629759 [Geopyxis carbonaria]